MLLHLFITDKTAAIGNFFNTGNLQALPLLDNLHKLAGIHQAVRRTGIKPGIAAAHNHHIQASFLQIQIIEVGNFQLAARRWLQITRLFHHIGRIKIQPDRSII